MDDIERIKKLEEANITLITDYLEDNYVILNNTFVNKHTNKSEWGYNVIEHLEPILSLDEDYITHVVKCWVHSKGMFEDKWDNAYLSVVLETIYRPNIQVGLERIIGVNGEKQMIAMLSQAISDEIDSEILRELKKKVTGFVEFQNLLKCLGYVFTEIMFDPDRFTPMRHITSTTEYDKIYEQQNNPYWKDWFRARRQDKET